MKHDIHMHLRMNQYSFETLLLGFLQTVWNRATYYFDGATYYFERGYILFFRINRFEGHELGHLLMFSAKNLENAVESGM